MHGVVWVLVGCDGHRLCAHHGATQVATAILIVLLRVTEGEGEGEGHQQNITRAVLPTQQSIGVCRHSRAIHTMHKQLLTQQLDTSLPKQQQPTPHKSYINQYVFIVYACVCI